VPFGLLLAAAAAVALEPIVWIVGAAAATLLLMLMLLFGVLTVHLSFPGTSMQLQHRKRECHCMVSQQL
jgi:hypothetical protein